MLSQLLVAVIFVGVAHCALSPLPCCLGPRNVILSSSRRCEDGAKIRLSCASSYVLTANESMEHGFVGDGGRLVFDGEDMNMSMYCVSTNSDKGKVYLVCFDEDESASDTARTTNAIFLYISVFFIILTIAVYISVPSLLDLQAICIVHSLLGLGTGYFTLGLLQLLNYISDDWCIILPFFPYTAFLYSFFWLNILSFHIWRTIVNPRLLKFTNRWSLIYHAFGIGSPLVCLLVLVTAQFSELPHFHHVRPNFGEVSCWFKGLKETFVYFYGPISALLLINIIYYVWTVMVLWRQMKQCSSEKMNSLKHRLILCLKLFFIMGITWIFEVLSAAMEPMQRRYPGFRVIWIITDTLNGLQGVTIFLILVVFRKRVRRHLANKKICNIRFPARWRSLKDEESDMVREEELNLSVMPPANGAVKT